MKRKTTAHSARCIHSSAETLSQHDVLKGVYALACAMALAFAVLLALGLHGWSNPDVALADETVQLTTSDEDEESPEDADEPIDSADDTSEASDNPEESEEGESSEASPSSDSPEEEGEWNEKEEVGGLLLRVVDIEMARKSGVEDGDLTGSQGDATLKGMKFNVYNEKGKLVKTMVADDDGLADLEESDYLPLGTYTVKQVAESARSLGYNPNSTWAGKGQNVTIEFAGDIADVGTCKCEIMRGAVRVNVVDSDLYDTLGVEDTAQGKASLAEAVFEVYNASSKAVLVGNRYYNPYNEWSDSNEAIMEMSTNEWGVATTDNDTGAFDAARGLPWGTYVVKQKEISKGYHAEEEALDAWSARVEVRGEDRFNLSEPVRMSVIRGGVKLQMVDGETKDGKAQGDATLKGATFEVINDNGPEGIVVMDGSAYAEGDVLLTLTTDKEGLATCAKNLLPYGSYKVRMAKNNKFRSYVYDKNWEESISITKNEKRARIDKGKSFKAKIARGGVTLKQLDSQSRKPVEGATIEIVNNSKKPVIVKGSAYEKGKVVYTFSPDAEGVAKTAKNLLPYGSYILRESEAAPGYDLNKEWNQEFQIRKAGRIVNAGKVYDELSPVLVEATPADVRGKANTILPILGVLIVAAALAAGFVVYRRRRQQEQELLEAALSGAGAAAITGSAAGSDAAATLSSMGAIAGEDETRTLSNTGRLMAVDAQVTQPVGVFDTGQITQPVEAFSTGPIMQPARGASSGQTTQVLDTAYYANDAEATRALIDDQATRAMQATLASRAARDRGATQASDIRSAETAALAANVPQVPQAISEPQTMSASQAAEATQAMRVPQDADITLLMNTPQVNRLPQIDESKEPTQPNCLSRAFQSLESDESDDPTQPNRLAQALEADQRTRVMQPTQNAQPAQPVQEQAEDYADDQEFGAILPAVVTKSEQKRARRANRWSKH